MTHNRNKVADNLISNFEAYSPQDILDFMLRGINEWELEEKVNPSIVQPLLYNDVACQVFALCLWKKWDKPELRGNHSRSLMGCLKLLRENLVKHHPMEHKKIPASVALVGQIGKFFSVNNLDGKVPELIIDFLRSK